MRRIARCLLVVTLLSGAAVAPTAGAEVCRLLVLGAMPVEIGPFLARATIENRVDIAITNEHDQQQLKSYFFGTLEGNDVIMAMTGIGTVNAMETARLAFDHLGCIDGVVFSGVSGGGAGQRIGDVLVPTTWTLDLADADGNTTTSQYAADAQMLDVAAAAAGTVALPSQGHIGDCACVGVDPAATPVIDFGYTPTITVGAGSTTLTGRSADPFGGHALPCVPASDTFGCQPCMFQQASSGDPARIVTGARPFATPEFFSWFQTWSAGTGVYDVQDMESAAVASVALGKAPFVAFRSPSDGAEGDPLPAVPGPFGFLSQFLLYRQYAADNAATVALAFLGAWSAQQA